MRCDGDTLWLTAHSVPGEPESETRIKLTRLEARTTQRSSAAPLAGTWKLNLAKSKYDPARLAPKSLEVRWVITASAVYYVSDGVNWEDRLTHAESTAKLDGRDYPWRATIDGQLSTTQDAVAIKKIDDYTYEEVNKLKGQVLNTQRLVVARDGRSRVTTTVGRTADGQPVTSTMVFERQQ